MYKLLLSSSEKSHFWKVIICSQGEYFFLSFKYRPFSRTECGGKQAVGFKSCLFWTNARKTTGVINSS